MSDNNRGAYTPQSEAPLAFDARRSSGSGDRPRSGALLISAIVLVVLIIAFVVFALTRAGEKGGETAQTFDAIKTGPDAVAAAPPAPEPATTLPVDAVQTLPPGGQPNFTAPPEQPQTRPLPGATPVPAAPAPAVAAAPAPAAVTTPAAKPVEAKPVAAAKPEPAAPAKPVAAAAAKPTTTPAPKASTAYSSAMVQIGAFASSALAEREWNDIALGIPAEMVGKTRQIEPIEVNGATRYRALIGGFGSRADADAFCDKLKARGRDCFARN